MPRIIYPDPVAVMLTYLRAELPALIPGVAVSHELPASRMGTSELPAVVVRCDGQVREPSLRNAAAVRLVCYGGSQHESMRIAALCEAVSLAAMTGDIRSVTGQAGPRPAQDPDTHDPMAVLTVTVLTMPKNL